MGEFTPKQMAHAIDIGFVNEQECLEYVDSRLSRMYVTLSGTLYCSSFAVNTLLMSVQRYAVKE